MKWSDLPLKPTARMLRQFAAAWLLVFAALAMREWLGRGHSTAACVLGTISLIGIAGLAKPMVIRWLFVGATILTFPIGWVVTQIVLALMFFLVLSPVALAFRLRRRDELQLRRKPQATSYWYERTKPSEPERYLKQF